MFRSIVAHLSDIFEPSCGINQSWLASISIVAYNYMHEYIKKIEASISYYLPLLALLPDITVPAIHHF